MPEMKEMLEELKTLDPETWGIFNHNAKRLVDSRDYIVNGYLINGAKAFLQYEVQRAIERRKWGMTLISHAECETGSRHICQIRKTDPAKGFYSTAETYPDEALLSAYIRALKEGGK